MDRPKTHNEIFRMMFNLAFPATIQQLEYVSRFLSDEKSSLQTIADIYNGEHNEKEKGELTEKEEMENYCKALVKLAALHQFICSSMKMNYTEKCKPGGTIEQDIEETLDLLNLYGELIPYFGEFDYDVINMEEKFFELFNQFRTITKKISNVAKNMNYSKMRTIMEV